MSNPDITVLLAVHNSATTLDRCLQSLQQQSYQGFTIVCINDASTDRSSELLLQWAKELGPKLHVITNKKNLGLTRSLNLGLEQITTTYTARIDGDDWWHPDKLKLQRAFLEHHPHYGLIGCHYQNISSTTTRTITTLETDRELKRALIKRNQFAHSCVMFRTNLIKELGGYDETMRYSQDYDLWLRLSPHTKFYNLPQLLCYRQTGSGISYERQREQMICGLKSKVRFIRRNKLPWYNYLYTLELIAIILTPEPLKRLKRAVRS